MEALPGNGGNKGKEGEEPYWTTLFYAFEDLELASQVEMSRLQDGFMAAHRQSYTP